MKRVRPLVAISALVLAGAAAGCGAQFDLPTETFQNVIPGDGSYQMVATWSGLAGVQDILLTQGTGTQLFLLFRRSGTDLSPRGEVRSYARKLSTGVPTPLSGIDFRGLFNPLAITSGGSATGGGAIFVLDAGDSCLAKTNPATPGVCDPAFTDSSRRILNFAATWRVREYGLLGGDTVSTFTDTTFADVKGIAADAQGNVYVAGSAIILVPDPSDDRIRTRQFQFRVYRYKRGPRYPGVTPPDRFMPGANWHRDSTWVIEEGSGLGTMVDPRGMAWSATGGTALYAADFGKNWVQKLSEARPSTGVYFLDGGRSGTAFNGPTDVVVDLQGFLYICDPGNNRVVRYSGEQDYVQTVNVELDAQGESLIEPVAVAADDSLVYVADRTLGKVIRYQRRN